MIDLDKFNPDWNFASRHGQASLPGSRMILQTQFVDPEEQICKCCLNVINKEKQNLCEHSKELEFLGTGFPVFYLFIKNCIILIMLMLVSYSVMALYKSVVYNEIPCDQEDHDYHRRLLVAGGYRCTSWMILVAQTQSTVSSEETIMRTLNFFIHLIMLIYMRNSILKTIEYFDQRHCAISDFALKIKGLEHQTKIQSKLKIFFQKAFSEAFKIRELTLIPHYEQIRVLVKQKKQLLKQMSKQLRRKQKDDLKIMQLSNQISQIDQLIQTQLQVYQQQIVNDQMTSSKIIVIFQQQITKLKIIEQAKKFTAEDYKQYFQGCCNDIKIRFAPQPKQIIWQNINYPENKRFLRVILGWILSIAFVLAAAFCFYFILRQKSSFLAETSDNNLALAAFLVYFLILIVILFNKFVMSYFLHHFAKLQKSDTSHKLQASFSFKYALGMFFTTALMTLAVQAISFRNYYTHLYGVIQQETIFFLMNAGFVPLIWLINPFQLFVLLRRKFYLNDKNITQRKANHFMQNFHYDMGKRYAQILETMWFTFLYLTLIPLGTVLTLFGLIMYYWIDKYNLLRRSSVMSNMSGKLGLAAMKQLDLTLIFRSAGQLLFDLQLRQGVRAQTISFLVISVVYLFLPMNEIIDFFNQQYFYAEQKSYSQVQHRFKDTYHTLHPVYSRINEQQLRKRLKTIIMDNSLSQRNIDQSDTRMIV